MGLMFKENSMMLARNECMTFGTTVRDDHVIDIRGTQTAQREELRDHQAVLGRTCGSISS